MHRMQKTGRRCFVESGAVKIIESWRSRSRYKARFAQPNRKTECVTLDRDQEGVVLLIKTKQEWQAVGLSRASVVDIQLQRGATGSKAVGLESNKIDKNTARPQDKRR